MAASKLCSMRCRLSSSVVAWPSSQVNWDQMFLPEQSPYRCGTAGGARRGDGMVRLSAGNHGAARFYQKCGWHLAGTVLNAAKDVERPIPAGKVAGPVRADPEPPGSWP